MTRLGECPSVSIKALGESLRVTPDTSTLEARVSDWLQENGWFSDRILLMDMRVNIQMPMLPRFRDLYEENREMVGWIQIEGTKANAPVMQTPDDPEFYLRHGFDHEETYIGLPFLDERNDIFNRSHNMIVYAHNLYNSGRMFGQISQYENKSFLEKHPIVKFDLLFERREYEVFAMFRSREYRGQETGFRYYDYIDLSDQKRFNEFVRQVKEISLQETGIIPVWGDEFLTLSTCSYHVNKGSFVVVCRRVR